MRVVGITDVRQDGTRIIREAQHATEPTLVVIRSEPAVYLVGARQYEAEQAELKRLRREAIERDVAEGEAAIAAGGLPIFDNADELIAHLHRQIDECE